MKRIITIALASASVQAGIPPAARAEGAGLFPLRLTPGEEFTYGLSELHDVTTTITSGKDDGNTLRHQTDVRLGVRVVSADAEGYDLELVYQRIRFVSWSSLVQDPPAFDTAEPPESAANNPFALVLLPLINKPMAMRVSLDGRIASFRPAEVRFVDHPNVGIGEWFITPDWVIPRVGPIFSLGAPPGAETGTEWKVVREARPVNSDGAVRITTTFKAGLEAGGVSLVAMTVSGEMDAPVDNADPSVRLESCTGMGKAQWAKDEGRLATYEHEVVWTVEVRSSASPPAEVRTTTRTMVARLR